MTFNQAQTKEYVIYGVTRNGNKEPLYIGMTSNFRRRISQHRTPSVWKRQPQHSLYKLMTIENRDEFFFSILAEANTLEEAQNLETEMIRTLCPSANTARGTKSSIKAYNFETGVKLEFQGLSECVKHTGQNPGNVNLVLKGHVNSINRWIFSDADEPEWEKLEAQARKFTSSKPKPVRGIDASTGEVLSFPSASAAAKHIGKSFGSSDIAKACKKENGKAYGFFWEFLDAAAVTV